MKRQKTKAKDKRKIGDIGEGVACNFLTNRGFEIIKTNYLKKYRGEIDIVAKKEGILHFFEVKSSTDIDKVSRPEENVNAKKIKNLRRTIISYLADECRSEYSSWQFHVICVYLDMTKRVAKVSVLKNLVI